MSSTILRTLLSFVVAVAMGIVGCTVEKTRSGKAPDVDLEPGLWPKYDVKWADVYVGTTKTITVPKLEWKREPTQIQVPYLDIKPPRAGDREGDREEWTISIELEVPSRGYDLQIREVRAAGDELWVISELVSDQVAVNTPEDLLVAS
jgi:hypothetical protein